jgi:hypothetical protein
MARLAMILMSEPGFTGFNGFTGSSLTIARKNPGNPGSNFH